jgi:hypothetical protein
LHGISGREEGEHQEDRPEPIRIDVGPLLRETSQSGFTT